MKRMEVDQDRIQLCPICGAHVRHNTRYPRYLCRDCAGLATSADGRCLEFANVGFSGGFVARFADSGEIYDSHLCFVRGVACRADEARFGGIVVEAQIRAIRRGADKRGTNVARDAYNVGMLVRHPLKPEWGLGKVLVLDGDAMKIHFKDDHQSDYRTILLSKSNLQVADEQTDSLLDNLPPFNGKAFEVPPTRVTFDAGLKRFTEFFPLGFQDPAYLSSERDYKWHAHERYERELGGRHGVELLEADDVESLSRAALGIASLNLLSPFEMMALKDGLLDRHAAKRFFGALFELINGGPDKTLFEKAASAASDLPAEPGRARVATWPVLTIFPYLARPDRFMFLKPQPTKDCADRLRFGLQYSADLRWITYSQLLLLSDTLLGLLRPYGARDYIDVQSFMWVVAKYQ